MNNKTRLGLKLWAVSVILMTSACKDLIEEFREHVDDKGKNDEISISDLRLIDEYIIPYNEMVDDTPVGGLSGIDWDGRHTWYLISDDRSQFAPARFYTATLEVQSNHLDVQLTEAVTILKPDGEPFLEGDYPDPEAIRYDPDSDNLIWTSEGERANAEVDPFVRTMNTDGSYVDEFDLPRRYEMNQLEEFGPRQNGVFESLTLAMGKSGYWTAIESPLFQDGPVARPEPDYEEAPVRIAYINAAGQFGREYAYVLDPVAAPSDIFFINGVVEILSIDRYRFLALERSFSVGEGNTVKLYEVDVHGTTDVSDLESLEGASYQAVDKKLLLDFADLALSTVDNIEGMSWGPKLANSNRTLVFVSDNNFSADAVNQVIALEVLP